MCGVRVIAYYAEYNVYVHPEADRIFINEHVNEERAGASRGGRANERESRVSDP